MIPNTKAINKINELVNVGISLRTQVSNLLCPDCAGDLIETREGYKCLKCQRRFLFKDGIHHFLPKTLNVSKIGEDERMKGVEHPSPWRVLLEHSARCLQHEKRLFDIIRTRSIKNVLEIGAGDGWASAITKLEFPKTNIYVSDISFQRIKRCLSVFNFFRLPAYFFLLDAENLPFKPNSFDLIFCWSVIHHLPNPRKAIKMLYKSLKNDGIFVADGEAAFSPFTINLAKKTLLKDELKYAEKWNIYEQKYTFNEWKSILSAGFKDFKIVIVKDLTIGFGRPYQPGLIRLPFYLLNKILPDFLIEKIGAAQIYIKAHK